MPRPLDARPGHGRQQVDERRADDERQEAEDVRARHGRASTRPRPSRTGPQPASASVPMPAPSATQSSATPYEAARIARRGPRAEPEWEQRRCRDRGDAREIDTPGEQPRPSNDERAAAGDADQHDEHGADGDPSHTGDPDGGRRGRHRCHRRAEEGHHARDRRRRGAREQQMERQPPTQAHRRRSQQRERSEDDEQRRDRDGGHGDPPVPMPACRQGGTSTAQAHQLRTSRHRVRRPPRLTPRPPPGRGRSCCGAAADPVVARGSTTSILEPVSSSGRRPRPATGRGRRGPRS